MTDIISRARAFLILFRNVDNPTDKDIAEFILFGGFDYTK